MLFFHIIDILFPLFFLVTTGALYARIFQPDMSTANALNMNIFLPALILSVLLSQQMSMHSLWPLAIAAALVVLGSGVLGLLIARLFSFNCKTFVPPIMFSNSGNMGLPLMTLTFGALALPAATVVFLVENVFHFTLGKIILRPKGNPFKNLTSPIMLATLLAIVLSTLQIPVPALLMQPVEMLGKVAVPLMLFSLGTRLAQASFGEWKIGLVAGITAPVCGVLLAFAIKPWFVLTPMQTGVLILFGALPPAVLNFMFAERYQQEPEKVASIVVISHLLTFISLPLALAYVLPRFASG